LLDAFRKKLH
jgi:calcyphosin